MSTIDVSQDLSDLSSAINIVESLLNSQDGDKILEKIRNYKKQKNQNTYSQCSNKNNA